MRGVADFNDPTRDVDRIDLLESVWALGRGPSHFRAGQIPRYVDLVRHVFARFGWDGDRFQGYRCRVEYPIYGSQITLAFDSPGEPPLRAPEEARRGGGLRPQDVT